MRIGTRSSRLALFQAERVRAELSRRFPAVRFEIREIRTSGDRSGEIISGRSAISPGMFTRKISEALLSGEADMAVHSAKDLPTRLLPRLVLGAILEREDPREAWICAGGLKFRDVPRGFRIGTFSPRRKAQVLSVRPDLEVIPFRGNVDTRLRKMKAGQADGLILAACGLRRLGLEREITELLEEETFLPAVGQGAIAVEIREKDAEVAKKVAALNDRTSFLRVLAERSMLARLQGGCQLPVGVTDRIQKKELWMKAAIYSFDGSRRVSSEVRGPANKAEALGEELAARLLNREGKKILKELRSGK